MGDIVVRSLSPGQITRYRARLDPGKQKETNMTTQETTGAPIDSGVGMLANLAGAGPGPGAGNVLPTLATIATAYGATERGTVAFRWQFAQDLARFVIAHPELSGDVIGRACSDATKETKPFDRQWVSRIKRAAQRFPVCPTSADDVRGFQLAWNGKSATVKPKGAGLTAEQAQSWALGMIRKALALGIDPDKLGADVGEVLREHKAAVAAAQAAAVVPIVNRAPVAMAA